MQTIAEQTAAHEATVILAKDGERHELVMCANVDASLRRWTNSMRRLLIEARVNGCP